MKRKCLIGLMSLLLVMVFGAPASADWVYDGTGPGDACGDTWNHLPYYDQAHQDEVDTKDIEQAMVEFYPVPHSGATCAGLSEVDCRAEAGCYYITSPTPQCKEAPEWVNLCINMCEGSTLPGQVQWEFDVDNDPGTGGENSMLGIPVSPSSNEFPLKTCAGFDLIVQKAYRFQGPGSAMDPGNPICYKKKAGTCTNCNVSPCFQRGSFCSTGTDCYVVDNTCESCDETGYDCNQYRPDNGDWVLCDDVSSAGIGKKRGGWTASLFGRGNPFVAVMGGVPVDWGRDMPEPPLASTAEAYCEKIPWRQILQTAVDEPGYQEAAFNNLASDPGPEFQVVAYHDPYYPTSHYPGSPVEMDDYMDTVISDYINITDWMPNAHCNKAPSQSSDGGLCHIYQNKFLHCMELLTTDEQDGVCQADMVPDGVVGFGDLKVIKREYNYGLPGNPPCP